MREASTSAVSHTEVLPTVVETSRNPSFSPLADLQKALEAGVPAGAAAD